MGCDPLSAGASTCTGCFNSRTPCGVRHTVRAIKAIDVRFQFTHPVWGATVMADKTGKSISVSIHAPRVGCDILTDPDSGNVVRFNSRTPCGVRPDSRSNKQWRRMFQFTHPVWGATHLHPLRQRRQVVSIHAPRVGCDSSASGRRSGSYSFNSRTPCGVRLILSEVTPIRYQVSIHAPRVGCDLE